MSHSCIDAIHLGPYPHPHLFLWRAEDVSTNEGGFGELERVGWDLQTGVRQMRLYGVATQRAGLSSAARSNPSMVKLMNVAAQTSCVAATSGRRGHWSPETTKKIGQLQKKPR